MIPSPRNIKTYDQKPEMSAKGVCDSVVSAIKSKVFDSIVVNFANTDMVGHSGNLKATITAAEFVDGCLKSILDVAIPANWNVFVFADHGNAEQMVNPRTGEPDTGHTTNPVPFIIVSSDPEIANLTLQGNGILGSIAPTVLDIEGIEKPSEMLNQSLIINERKSL
jgi:2,3-bisphosphoglycerate-independent phosphoglycerate mutase